MLRFSRERPAAPFVAEPVRTPTVVQQEAVECGAAALGIVLGYYGRIVRLEEPRVACGVSRDGAKASNILKAARTYGFEATGMRTETSGLAKSPLPAILFWNFNHFVVLEGATSRGVRVNDPAVGPRRVSWKEFEESYTGIVLELTPGPDFEPGGSRPRLVSALAARLSVVAAAAPLLVCVTAGLALAIPGLIVPAFLKLFVDLVLGQGDSNLVPALVLGLVAAAIAQAGLTWLQQVVLIRLSTKLSLSMSTRFVAHMLRLPVGFFLQRFAGHLVARVALNDRVAGLVSSQLTTTLLSLVSAAVYGLAMLLIDPLLGAGTIALGAANVVALRAVSRRRRDVNVVLVSETAKLQAVSFAGIQAIETLKASGSEDDFFARWSGQQAKVVNGSQKLGVATQALAAVPAFLAALSGAAIVTLGALRVLHGALSLGSLLALQSLAIAFTVPIQSLVTLGETLQEAEGDLATLDDVLRYPTQTTNGRGAVAGAPARLSGRLELERVTFGYSPLAPPLIDRLSLVIQPGHRVAIVGPTASGKSTVARLAAGLYLPWSGRILLDGVAREELAPDLIAAAVSLVDQEINLFEASIRENISLWDPTISEQAIVLAARDASIHPDIARRTGAYDRRLEEGARDWSGGQRQRLEIARALAGDPVLVILDEATSSLDPIVEREIDEALRARGCACLIVAHRLSTIRDCDEIIVLDQGRVVQRGVLANVVERRQDGIAEPGESPITAACRIVGGPLGLRVIEPAILRGPSLVGRLRAVARASGFRFREVRLDEGWWQRDVGPLIGIDESQQPVALVRRKGRYERFDPALGTRSTVHQATAATLAPTAYMLYASLGPGPAAGRGLARLALLPVRGDLLRLLVSSIVETQWTCRPPKDRRWPRTHLGRRERDVIDDQRPFGAIAEGHVRDLDPSGQPTGVTVPRRDFRALCTIGRARSHSTVDWVTVENTLTRPRRSGPGGSSLPPARGCRDHRPSSCERTTPADPAAGRSRRLGCRSRRASPLAAAPGPA